MTSGQVWYAEYLQSRHFRRQRQLAWVLSFRCCSICWKRYDLQPHHLSYWVLGRWFEFLFLRFVCSRCHRVVQYIWGRNLRGTVELHLFYYIVQVTYLVTVGVYRFIKWIISSYWITTRQDKRIRRRRLGIRLRG